MMSKSIIYIQTKTESIQIIIKKTNIIMVLCHVYLVVALF